MSADLEREAREAAVASGLDNYKHRRHDFADGYIAAATAREKEIEELRNLSWQKLAERDAEIASLRAKLEAVEKQVDDYEEKMSHVPAGFFA